MESINLRPCENRVRYNECCTALGCPCKEVCVDVGQHVSFEEASGPSVPYFTVHGASENMQWDSLINCSGEDAETSHKINVKGRRSNVNQLDLVLCTLIKPCPLSASRSSSFALVA